MTTVVIDDLLSRGTDSYRCECGGFAEEVDCTAEELKDYGCGRPYACCTAAFVCAICGTRYVARLEAPEMEWD